LLRSLATMATTTRPTVMQRSITTEPALGTPPTVLSPSITTRTASATRPTVLERSLATPATTTPPLAIRPAPTSRAMATSVLGRAFAVLVARTTPLVSAIFTGRCSLLLGLTQTLLLYIAAADSDAAKYVRGAINTKKRR